MRGLKGQSLYHAENTNGFIEIEVSW